MLCPYTPGSYLQHCSAQCHYLSNCHLSPCKTYHFRISRHPYTLTASDTPSYYLIESRMLNFVIAEEDLRIEASYPFNEVTAVFLLNNPRYHHTSHSDEPLLYHRKLIVCSVLLDGVYVFVFMLSYFLHFINLGQYSLQRLNFRILTKCVCIDLTEVTIASLTLSTVHQVILFQASLSTV